MSIPSLIQSQYLATLEMLKQSVEKCPAKLWLDTSYKNRFWHVAYHALFYTHLYLSESEKTFTPWARHREESNFMGPLPWPPHDPPKACEPYTREEVLEYLAVCQQEVRRLVPILDFDSPQSGFFWLPFGKLELQVYNIRHLQQHTGELMERLGVSSGIDVNWVGMNEA